MAWQLRVTFDNAPREKALEELQTYVKQTQLIVRDAKVVKAEVDLTDEGEWDVKDDPYVLHLTIEDLAHLMQAWR